MRSAMKFEWGRSMKMEHWMAEQTRVGSFEYLLPMAWKKEWRKQLGSSKFDQLEFFLLLISDLLE